MLDLAEEYMKDEIPDEIEEGNIYLVKSRDIHPTYGIMFIGSCEAIIYTDNGYENCDVDDVEGSFIIIKELNPQKVKVTVLF